MFFFHSEWIEKKKWLENAIKSRFQKNKLEGYAKVKKIKIKKIKKQTNKQAKIKHTHKHEKKIK